MKKGLIFSLIVIITVAVLGGCQGEENSEPVLRPAGHSSDALQYYQPTFPRVFAYLVGRGLNGTSLNGQVLDGHWITGISLENVEMTDGDDDDYGFNWSDWNNWDDDEYGDDDDDDFDERNFETLALDGTSFRTVNSRGRLGRRYNERQIVGTIFTATLDDGSTLPLRINAMIRDEERRNRDVYRYEVTYRTDETWQPLCGTDDDGNPILAIPLSGRWDYREGVEGGGSHIEDSSAITFGCDGYVLSKCVDMGYKPWSNGWLCDEDFRGFSRCQRFSLRGHHQACTRTLRADYCGDGVSYTENGTWLNVYDGIGIRTDGEDWDIEAEWDENGARCVVRERSNPPMIPDCWDSLPTDDCGNTAHFEDSTLLISETI